jgi:hypothetical protein
LLLQQQQGDSGDDESNNNNNNDNNRRRRKQQQQQDRPTQTSKEIDDKENKQRLQLSVVWFLAVLKTASQSLNSWCSMLQEFRHENQQR